MIESFLNRLERQWGQWAVPGLIRYLAIIFVGVFLASAIRPSFTASLDFNYQKIIAGEWWRMVSFVFAPQVGSFSGLNLIFLFFGTMLLFAFSDALEAQWGTFRTNLYIFIGFLSTLVCNLLFAIFLEMQFGLSGIYLATSILFAFALYYPKFTINLFLIIPCPIWIIAALTGAFLIAGNLTHPAALIHSLGCLSNFLLIAIVTLSRSGRLQRSGRMRMHKFRDVIVQEAGEPFHKCHACGATDTSHPDRDFRVGADGHDYCDKHQANKS